MDPRIFKPGGSPAAVSAPCLQDDHFFRDEQTAKSYLKGKRLAWALIQENKSVMVFKVMCQLGWKVADAEKAENAEVTAILAKQKSSKKNFWILRGEPEFSQLQRESKIVDSFEIDYDEMYKLIHRTQHYSPDKQIRPPRIWEKKEAAHDWLNEDPARRFAVANSSSYGSLGVFVAKYINLESKGSVVIAQPLFWKDGVPRGHKGSQCATAPLDAGNEKNWFGYPADLENLYKNLGIVRGLGVIKKSGHQSQSSEKTDDPIIRVAPPASVVGDPVLEVLTKTAETLTRMAAGFRG